jgi:hypothetical protein
MGPIELTGTKERGIATVSLLLLIVLLAVLYVCAGCTSLTEAGHVMYSLEPAPGGYKFTASDGKEFASRVISVTKEGVLTIVEGASSAFQGQAIAGKALAILPSFAPVIMGPGPATLAAPPGRP